MLGQIFVNEIFRDNKYTATQHLIGTINISIDRTTGTTASMTSYLHATHLLPNGSINVANGTYGRRRSQDSRGLAHSEADAQAYYVLESGVTAGFRQVGVPPLQFICRNFLFSPIQIPLLLRIA